MWSKYPHDKTRKNTRNTWSEEEIEKLVELVDTFRSKNWKAISKGLNGKTANQCLTKYSIINQEIKHGKFTKQEDKRIIELYKIYGNRWTKIGKMLGNRYGRQIRNRFVNNWDPSLKKGRFTKAEDGTIISEMTKCGKCWSKIAKKLPGRTPDMIKNRFYHALNNQFESKTLVWKNENGIIWKCNFYKPVINSCFNLNSGLSIGLSFGSVPRLGSCISSYSGLSSRSGFGVCSAPPLGLCPCHESCPSSNPENAIENIEWMLSGNNIFNYNFSNNIFISSGEEPGVDSCAFELDFPGLNNGELISNSNYINEQTQLCFNHEYNKTVNSFNNFLVD